MTQLELAIALETHSDNPSITALHRRAFGPGRFVRTASRLRETAPLDERLCFTARVGTLLVASIRQSAIMAGVSPALLLGPLAVEPAFESRGIGTSLIARSIAVAKTLPYDFLILVGDEPYYKRHGFRVAPFGRLRLPGPVDPHRLLYLELVDGSLTTLSGEVEVRGGALQGVS